MLKKISIDSMNDAEKIIIIAEAGVNHNASMEMARRMVVEAARAGAY